MVAGARAYEKKFPNVTFEKVAVTNQRFNNTAISQAKLHDVLLIEGIELSLWLVACGLWLVACGLWLVACGLWLVNYPVLLSFLQR